MFGASKSGSAAATDPQFEYVTALISGDGTNGAQNNTFIDSSANNATITRFANTTQGTFTSYGDSWSNYFPGSSYFTSAALATNRLLGDYTIEFWFNQTVAGKQGLVTVTATASSGQAGMSVYIDSAPSNSLTLFIDGNVTTNTSATNVFTINTWNHIAVVYTSSATQAKVYLNGTSVVTLTRTATFSTNPVISIGRIFGDNTGSTFNGYISNVRILKGTALYTANFTPPTTPFTAIANTHFLGCNSNNFLDNGPNAFPLTITAVIPSVQRYSPFGNYSLTPPSYSTSFNATTGNTSTDYITVPYSASHNLAANNFTIESWIFPKETPAVSYGIINNWQNEGEFSFNMSSSRLLKFGWTNAASGNTTSDLNGTTATITLNTWNHVAVVRDGATMKLYVNGVADATTFNNGANTIYYYNGTAKDLRIGVGNDLGAGTYFSGYISNLRLVNGTAIYTANFTPPTGPLTSVANTRLLTCQNTTLIDNSTNASTLTPTTSPKPKEFNPFSYNTSSTQSYSPAIHGGSLYFDGTGDYLTIPYNAAYNIAANTSMCFEGWVYTTSTNTFVMANRNWAFGSTGPTWGFSINSGITPTWNLAGTGSATYVMAQSAINGVLGQWNHYAFTRDASNVVRIFVNGVLGVSRTDSQAMTSVSGSIFVGVSSNLASPYALGYMTDVRFVVGSPVYTANFVPPDTPLTAIANTQLLLNGTNAGIYDGSLMNDFETLDNTQISTSVKKYGTGSISFDGTGDWLLVPDNVNQQLTAGDFTIEGWVYLNAIGVAYGIVSKGAAATGWSVNITSGNKLQFSYTASNLTGGTSLAASTWYYFSVVRSGTATGNLKLYLNGLLEATSGGAVTDSFTQTTSLYVGASRTGTTALNGYIDELRITKGYARYTANTAAPTQAWPRS